MINRLVGFALVSIAITAAIAPRLQPANATFSSASKSSTARRAPDADAENAGDGEAMVLRRDGSGQFHMTATVMNEDVTFLVDTGADVVALTEETADRLGLLPEPEAFQPLMKTASGTGYGAPIVLESVEIGGEEFRGVEAVVMRGLGTNLMGQSVLGRMEKVELRGDSMVIQPS